jgi:pyridoxal phosphate-dependent aminotransferase EpsN
LEKRILLSSPHMSGKEQFYINDAFEKNWIAPLGENVNEFENKISNYVGVDQAAVLSSGTAALHLALSLIGVGKDDIVFVQDFTFIASVNPILYQGATPVFIDSEPETWNMSPTALKAALKDFDKKNKLPKAIIVVNLYGQMAKYDELKKEADKFNIPIIEDAAESLGSLYKNKKSGTLGEIAAFSFNGNKIITTSGGGALVSKDEQYVIKSRFLATQARDQAPYYQHSTVGYNYRLSNISAGIGIAQMDVLDERVKKRRENFDFYANHFEDLDSVRMMPEVKGHFSNRWLSTITIDSLNSIEEVSEIVSRMNDKNIETRPLWKPMHMQPLFEDCAYYTHNQDESSISENLFNKGLCLPSGSNLTEGDLTRVVEEFRKIIIER